MNIGYAFPDQAGPFKGLRAQLTATNIFDRDPPYVQYSNGLYGIGYNPENSDPLGRVVAIQLIKTW